MPDVLQDRLQSSLGTAYTLERELSGGGMSRVFVAHDEALGRRVVVKVLAPELAQGLSAERFAREIRLAATLQQANIVPVLAAGTTEDGLPYYTMPYVEGESLRLRLAAGPLAIRDAVSVLRDVARALAYAHGRGIAHRDVKPDNVLLSGGAAVVTDFGIAKALGAALARGGADPLTGGALTGLGSAIGTPAYMAPEQSAADPDADHRVDVYAFGCLAYELLTGASPFAGLPPHKLLIAHLNERPKPVESLRPDVPTELAVLVARCLEKDPDHRPQRADDVLHALDAVSTGGMTAVPAFLLGGPASFRRALALYAVAFVAVAVLARAAIVGIGLPDWVFPGALAAMGLGFPVLLFTAYARQVARRVAAMTPTYTPNGSPATQHGTVAQIALKANPHLSWRRTARWAGFALVAFVLLVAGAMTLRVLGVGPFGTLLAAGTMKADDAIVVADFASPGDSTLGRTVAQGVKADLAQSRAVHVLSDDAVATVLRRMQRSDDRLTLAVAREVAARAGAEMVVDGGIAPLGTGFLLTLRLVTADSGREVIAYRSSVDSPGELIGEVGKLTRKLRAHIGESLREVQGSPRLEDATTASLDALRKYTEGVRALASSGDRPRFVRLMGEAIALDSTFAAAYQRLAVELDNRGGRQGEAARLVARAYALRDRLPPREQRQIEYFYFLAGPPETRDSARAIATLLAQAADPADRDRSLVLNNLGWTFQLRGMRAQAESVYHLAIAADTTYRFPLSNLVQLREEYGDLAGADTLVPLFRRRFPGGYTGLLVSSALLRGRGQLDSAEAMLRQALAGTADPFSQAEYASAIATIAGIGGRVRDFDATTARLAEARRARGVATADLDAALDRATFHALVAGDGARAGRILDSAAVDRVAEGVDPLDRPHAMAAIAYAVAGDAPAARRHLAGVERQIPEADLGRSYLLRLARAHVAIAERRWDDAIREGRLARVGRCTWCGHLPLALAYDASGARDSAVAAFERTRVGAPMRRQVGALGELAAGPVLRRLGELYEAKGDVPSAIDRYERFAALWRRADPQLQPQVAEVRARIARLRARAGG